MKKILVRFLYGLLFAVPLMLVTFALAQAANKPQAGPTSSLDCKQCHTAIYQAWESGYHGKSMSDPVFTKDWEAKGRPNDCLKCHVTGYDPATNTMKADGITCEACHSPIISNHPLAPMSTNPSSKMCGDCHTETLFEFNASAHQQQGMDCVSCHDQHATTLKEANAGTLCSSCHQDRATNFNHTQHNQQGLTCADCHVNRLQQTPSEGLAKVDHSFFVNLNACSRCHAYQLHNTDVGAVIATPTPAPAADSMTSAEHATASREPQPVSPLGFTTLSGLVGIAFGVIMAPYIDKVYRRNPKKDDEKKGE
jgi:predicted CXXCH cytochrome family protein